MKNIYRKGSAVALTFCMIGLSFGASAQNESDVAAFLQTVKTDANVLIRGYTNPVVKGASYGMTGAWFNTAKAHKTLGFDLQISMTLAFTPSSDNYFNPRPDLTNTTFTNQTNSASGAPTFVGPKDKTSYTSLYKAPNGTVTPLTFNGPEGLNLKHYVGFSAVPVPMIQLGIGIIKNTDLKIRYLPNVKVGDSHVQMLGVGIMHDIHQYLPGADFLPFDLSILAAFNSMKGVTTLYNSDPSSEKPTSSDGKFTYKLKSYVGQAIISKKISVLTGYLGVGYGSVNTNADITGTFTVNSAGSPVGVPLTDPYSTKFNNKSAKLTAGLRLKLGPIFFVGDYTLQKYNALTVGFGVAIR